MLALNYQNTGQDEAAKAIFKEIIASQTANDPASVNAGEVIVLAAYWQLGEREAAEKLAEQWRVLFPGKEFTDWTALWLAGNNKELAAQIASRQQKEEILKVGSGEYYLQWVFDFLAAN